ncbi:hypothetical protein [Leifsonia naganoensis]|uniref:Uncharacterized protein n=1 Tax=Leifsonia naganoensis TaxID=150025 RepID=A0A853DV08_9MICO|nr:hypothetical protein [Leifsonia naganoensis]NYK09645.1 hypothetical protein [Leifsonia naganoensis]
MKPSWEHPVFRDILLTETYVFDFELHPGLFELQVDFVLASSHPLYEGAAPGEAFDYRRGKIIFSGVSAFRWESTGGRVTVDLDGSSDWDTFDSADWDDSVWAFRGQFGNITLVAETVDAVFSHVARGAGY